MNSCQDPRRNRPKPSTLVAKPFVVAIVGPTASGKTDAALAIAKKYTGEIIVADSRQVYRGMDIGTNKVHRTWNMKHGTKTFLVDGVPYWGIDLVEPNETFTVQQWKQYAIEKINEITKRGKLPIIEGGTGLYIWALLDNLTIPEVPPDPKLRVEIENRIAKEGLAAVAQEILETDPEASMFLQLDNPRRVIRALEVIMKSGLPYSQQRTKGPKSFRDVRIGIDPGVTVVDQRIEKRAHEQFAKGLETEVRGLAKRFGWEISAMSGIGYAEWYEALKHGLSDASREEALLTNIRRNKQFSRAQRKWFRRDPTIQWVKSETEVFEKIQQFLA